MTVIDGAFGNQVHRTSRTTPIRRRQHPNADPACIPADTDPAEAACVAPAAGPATLFGLLALQEREAGDVADGKGRKRGTAMLEGLATLQLALLRPEGPAAADLARLARLCDAVPQADDAALHAILQSIALRARIELARHGR